MTEHTLRANALVRAMQIVLPHVSGGYEHSALTWVRLRIRDGVCQVAGTDSFTLALAEFDASAPDMLVWVDGRRLHYALQYAGGVGYTTFTVDADTFTVSGDEHGRRASLPVCHGKTLDPDDVMAKVEAAHAEGTPQGAMGFSPDLLARLDVLDRHKVRLRFCGPRDPLLVDGEMQGLGVRFRMALMPLLLEEA